MAAPPIGGLMSSGPTASGASGVAACTPDQCSDRESGALFDALQRLTDIRAAPGKDFSERANIPAIKSVYFNGATKSRWVRRR
jgi:hypothetical protein